MRIKFLSLALIISIFVAAAPAGFAQRKVATQITFVQAPQSSNQPTPQGPPPERQGLPPEKKRSLSKYGPEDIFGASEQEDKKAREARLRQEAALLKPTPSPTPAAKPAATPAQPAVVNPSPTVTPSNPAAETPSPTIAAASLDNQAQQPPLAQQSSPVRGVSKWTLPVLSLLALAVFGALIFMVSKLREKIRESSPGAWHK